MNEYKMLQFKQGFEAVRPAMKRKADDRAMEVLDQHIQTAGPVVPPATAVYPMKDTLNKRIQRVSGKKGGAKVEKEMTPEERKTMDQLHKLLGSAKPEMLEEYYGEEAPKKRAPRRKLAGGMGPFPDQAPPRNAPASARLPVTGATVNPASVVPVDRPEAPASFRRNRVGMGKVAEVSMMGDALPTGGAMCGSGPGCGCGGAKQGRKSREDERMAMEVKGLKDKMQGGAMSSAKMLVAKISRMMKEKGMKLGEASRYLKEHPDA
jgi:hypothetical protein